MSFFERSGFAQGPAETLTIEVDGTIFPIWTRASIVRDLGEISGSFQIECHDVARAMAALPPRLRPVLSPKTLRWGQACIIAIDGEMVLRGWIEDVQPFISGHHVGLQITGRDVTGDLVDCAAAPKGPVEFKRIKLEDFAAKICAPFGIAVIVEVDTGEPLDISIDASETAMSAIEKAARKRGILVCSDGVGGLILTRSGQSRAPGDVVLGYNVVQARARLSSVRRFSDVFVKSQNESASTDGGFDGEAAALSASSAPRASAPPAGDRDKATGRTSREVAVQGHAQDPEVDRWRPTVKMARTSSSVGDARTQAQWYVANARGASESAYYSLHGWRVNSALWRPNAMTYVRDEWNDLDKDLLIAGIAFTYGQQGSMTELRLTGPEAYDIMPDDDDSGRGSAENSDLDGTAETFR